MCVSKRRTLTAKLELYSGIVTVAVTVWGVLFSLQQQGVIIIQLIVI